MRFHASSVFTNTDLGRSGNGTKKTRYTPAYPSFTI